MRRTWWRVVKRFVLLVCNLALATGAIKASIMGGEALRHWMLTAPDFDIVDISVYNNDLITSDEVILLSGLNIGTNIFQADLNLAYHRLESDPRFMDVFLRPEYPNHISIFVDEKRPVAYIQLDRMYGLDEDAAVIPLTTTERLPDLPVITGSGNLRPDMFETSGEGRANPSAENEFSLIQALYIIEKLRSHSSEMLSRISEVYIADPIDPILFTTEDGIVVRIGVGSLTDKLERLDSMLTQLENVDIKTPIIDLRFRDQVIIRPIITARQPAEQS